MARKILTNLIDLAKLPKTRDEARTIGSKWFFTGKPCGREHVAARLTSSATCMECHRNRAAEKYHENPEPTIERSLKRLEEWREADLEGFLKYQREKMRDWRAANPERTLEIDRDYKEANRDDLNEQARDRYAKNPNPHRKKVKKWRDENPDKAHQNFRRWALNNPDRIKIRDQNKRARRRGAKGKYNLEDLLIIGRWQDEKCIYCREPFDDNLTVEHFIALANGGTNWPYNIGLACGDCNFKKHRMEPVEFLIKYGLPLHCEFPKKF